MEAAQHQPPCGEQTPEALEDGGNASRAPESPNDVGEGPQNARSYEGPHDSGGHEGPRVPQYTVNEGPGYTRTSNDNEGPSHTGTSDDNEGPSHASTRIGNEGLIHTGTSDGNEGLIHTGTSHGNEALIHTGASDGNEGLIHTGTSDDNEGPWHAKTSHGDEAPRSTRISNVNERPTFTRTCIDDEGPSRTGERNDNEGLSHTKTGYGNEGSTDARTSIDNEGLSYTKTGHGNEGSSSPRPSNDYEGPRPTRISNEQRSGNFISRSHETASSTTLSNSKEYEISGADEGPIVSRDITAEQWASSAERLPNAQSKEPHVSESSLSSEPLSESDFNSFKKPVAPARHEKTLEPGPKQQSPVPSPDWQASPNVSPGLPSDAYKSTPAIPYGEPTWSGKPQALYSLEVLKGGSILSTKNLSDASWTVFGRLPVCHVSLEHPSVSRFHAVLQYCSTPGPDQERGFYVFDLGSTHGTFVNKQRIPPKTYFRIRVGHVMKFGGSTRLFILQGPEEDQEAESDLTVTQIKEARQQRESLQKRMLGDDSDEEDEPSEGSKKEQTSTGEESGCTWGMGEDALEDENEENPIAMEFQEDQEALYLRNPKKALQGFFDREGEELEFEYDERGPGSWICRIKLPADDSAGKQLVAEVVHSGKKKEAANLCALEACRILEMRGLLRQEAVSRKRKAKKWEDEDYYDSDDDTFLDRTGLVEKKRLNRMKKAGKIEEKPETFESLTAKLELVEKEISEVAAKLRTSQTGGSQPSTQDSLDAYMTEMKAESSLDSVSRKKLHLQSLELKKEQQRLKNLIKIVQPTKLPELRANSGTDDSKAKKLTLPMFGAMKGGSKFKLKTGTVGRIPPKRTDLPATLFTMKDTDEPEEEEEEDEEIKVENTKERHSEDIPTETATAEQDTATAEQESVTVKQDTATAEHIVRRDPVPEALASSRPEKVQVTGPDKIQEVSEPSTSTHSLNGQQKPRTTKDAISKPTAEKAKKKYGPSKPPQGVLATQYPEDDPDYCVWTPPAGQSGDGKTHLNEKYGY